jgi:cysteine desulfurase / selenocysteine lyase
MPVAVPSLVPRTDFPLLTEVSYLNQASLGLVPVPVIDRIRAYDDAHLGRGNHNLSDEVEAAILDDVRTAAARLLRAQPLDVAVTAGATEVIGQIAWATRPAASTNIVCIGDDFPSVTYPWLRVAEVTGAEVRLATAGAQPDEDTVDNIGLVVDGSTAVICVSHVLYHTGERLDLDRLRALARAAGALLVIDVTQSAGAVDLDLGRLDPDFAVASGYKWLCGPGGAAVAYVSPRQQAAFRPAIPGWKGTPDPFDFDARTIRHALGARRLELSTMAYGAALGLGAAMTYLDEIGVARIEQHNGRLLEYLVDGLKELDADVVTPAPSAKRASILTARFGGHDAHEMTEGLLDDGVNVSQRGGGLRFSLDFYNDSGDVDRALASLRRTWRRTRR